MSTFKQLMPSIAFCLIVIKGLAMGFQPTDAVVATTLAFFLGYIEYRKDRSENDVLKKQIEDVKLIQSVYDKRLSDLSTHVNGLKLGQNVRTGAFR